MNKRNLGFIGLGKMGLPMATNLLATGFALTVYDLDEKPVNELDKVGAQAVNSSKDVGEKSEVVWIMVTHQAVEKVVLGDGGVLSGMRQGGIIIDGGNSNPVSSQRIARITAERAVAFLDVGCSGGPEGAAKGTLAIMVGGDRRTYEDCLPIFKALGSQVAYFGPSGMGHLVKVINNMVVAITSMGIAEALAFAMKNGLNPSAVAEVLNAGVGQSWLPELAKRIFDCPGGIEGIGSRIGGGD